jgi:UDP-N-acetyl-D-glucosamine dehydrogenase
VVGGISPQAVTLAVSLYRHIIRRIIPVSSVRTAEAVKLLENTFRLINIGLVDELAMMAHKMDINIWEVIHAAATKPFGFMPFYPGPGVGGHCIPKDPLYLDWKARSYGFSSRFIQLASNVISFMPRYVAGRVISLCDKEIKPKGRIKVLVVGVTYKKDVKDLRKSPAIDVINSLNAKKAVVSYYDPLIPYLKLGRLNLRSISLSSAKLKEFDCVLIAAEHSSINWSFILKHSKLIFDTRNVFKGKINKKVYIL